MKKKNFLILDSWEREGCNNTNINTNTTTTTTTNNNSYFVFN